MSSVRFGMLMYDVLLGLVSIACQENLIYTNKYLCRPNMCMDDILWCSKCESVYAISQRTDFNRSRAMWWLYKFLNVSSVSCICMWLTFFEWKFNPFILTPAYKFVRSRWKIYAFFSSLCVCINIASLMLLVL